MTSEDVQKILNPNTPDNGWKGKKAYTKCGFHLGMPNIFCPPCGNDYNLKTANLDGSSL